MPHLPILARMETGFDIDGLPRRLQSSDPRVRVSTLRILAMVEETQALRAVTWIASHDPEPGVREVAAWAEAILRRAHERGHSTRAAVEALFAPQAANKREEAFLSELELDVARADLGRASNYALAQAYRRELDEALRAARPVPVEAEDTPAALPAPAGQPALSVDGPPDFSDLLDAGLTYLTPE